MAYIFNIALTRMRSIRRNMSELASDSGCEEKNGVITQTNTSLYQHYTIVFSSFSVLESYNNILYVHVERSLTLISPITQKGITLCNNDNKRIRIIEEVGIII